MPIAEDDATWKGLDLPNLSKFAGQRLSQGPKELMNEPKGPMLDFGPGKGDLPSHVNVHTGSLRFPQGKGM